MRFKIGMMNLGWLPTDAPRPRPSPRPSNPARLSTQTRTPSSHRTGMALRSRRRHRLHARARSSRRGRHPRYCSRVDSRRQIKGGTAGSTIRPTRVLNPCPLGCRLGGFSILSLAGYRVAAGGLTAGPLLLPGWPGIFDESCSRIVRLCWSMSVPVVSD
jgi:hypothetical protein